MSINELEFSSFDFEDFRDRFLLEKSLDKTPRHRIGGELSRTLSKTRADVAHQLNSWGSDITAKVERYVKKLKKRNPETTANVRYIPVGDGQLGEAVIIVVNLSNEELEIAIFDNNRITIKMSGAIAKKVNKGHKRKYMANKDRVADYIIGVLERML